MPRPSRPHPYKKSVVRYTTPDGKRCRAGDPGAIKHTSKTSTYYADLPGRPDVALGTANEAEAWAKLRELLKRAHDEALGIVDRYSDHARTELAAHVAEWGRVLTAKGTTREQIDLATGRMLRLAELAGWKRLPQITADSAQIALARVQAPAPAGLGKSAATRNHYLGHLKAFVAWCSDGGRIRGNPVRRLSPVNTEGDRRHARRIPSAAEVAELCRWLGTEAAPTRKRLSGAERRLGYLVSMTTGFRAGELRSLSPASFRLDEGTVTVPGAYSKRRRTDTQHLPAWLVEELRVWFAEGNHWHWSELNKNGPGRMLQADLADCRAAWIVAGGDATSDFLKYETLTPEGPRYLDYHSFRHSFATHMASLPGMDLKTLLSLTRLSSAQLALRTYAHSEQQRIRDAAQGQQPPSAPETPSEK
jgi:integrase